MDACALDRKGVLWWLGENPKLSPPCVKYILFLFLLACFNSQGRADIGLQIEAIGINNGLLGY